MTNYDNSLKWHSLEEEFIYYAIQMNLPKCNKMLPKMIDYYKTIEQSEINLSGIYDNTESWAKREFVNVLFSDINKFESLYEKAYSELI